jgi:hypothetical protein
VAPAGSVLPAAGWGLLEARIVVCRVAVPPPTFATVTEVAWPASSGQTQRAE